MTRHPFEYDLITIGGGSAGIRGSRFAARNYNAKVALVELPYDIIASEESGGVGGTCIIRGCFAKKLLMQGAAFSQTFQDAAGFGWKGTDDAHFAWSDLIEHKSKEVDRVRNVYHEVVRNNGIERIEGRATFQDAHTILVHNAEGDLLRTLTGANILIATGSRPAKLDIPGADLAITSDQALSLPQAPKRVLIIGAGRVGTEFTTIFSGAGAQVHLVFKEELPLPGIDMDCRHAVRTNLKSRATLHARTRATAIERLDDGSLRVACKCDDGGADSSLEVDQKVRVALGHRKQVIVNERLTTNVSHIWAAGDVTGRRNLTPVALMEGMAFANFCFGKKGETQPALEYAGIPSAVFTRPPVATVGLTEHEVSERYTGAFDIYISKFKTMLHIFSGRDERTLIKVIVHADSDTVVGAHIVGADAPEMLVGVAIAMKAGAKKAHFDATHGVHPTAAEELTTMRHKVRTVVGTGFKKIGAASDSVAAGTPKAGVAAAGGASGSRGTVVGTGT